MKKRAVSLLATLLFSLPVGAAITVDGTPPSNSSTTGLTISVSLTTTGTNEIVVAGCSTSDGSTLTMSGGGLTWTQVQIIAATGGNGGTATFWALAASTLTSATLTCTAGATGGGGMFLGVAALAGAATVTPIGAHKTVANAFAAMSTTLTTTGATGSFIFTSVVDGGNDSIAAATNNTIIGGPVLGLRGCSAASFRYTTLVTAGTYTVGSSTSSSFGYGVATMEILTGGGAAAVTPERTLTGVGN